MSQGTERFECNAQHIGDYDIVVVGGGPAGTGAAVASARRGARTLLIEASGILGGAATLAGVSAFFGGTKRYGDNEWAVGGIYKEIVETLHARDQACLPGADAGLLGNFDETHVFFNVEALKLLLDEMVTQSGVDLLFFSSFLNVKKTGGKLDGVFFTNKGGLCYAGAKMFIDCSGDADMVASAGFPFVKGRTDTGLMTAATLMSFYEDIDVEAVEKHLRQAVDEGQNLIAAMRFGDLVEKLKAQGNWPWAEEKIIMLPTHDKKIFYNNTSRQVGVDGTDPRSLTDAMIYGRKHATEFLENVIRPFFPGGADARLHSTFPAMGIRETRKITGEYVLTDDDCQAGIIFEDTIALSSHPFDLPDPQKPSTQPYMSEFNGGKSRNLDRGFCAIPYRCLIPENSENLLVAGRCLSAKDMALGSVRTMPACYAMGQAAGTAALLCIKDNCGVRGLDFSKLRGALLEQNAILE